MSGERRSRRAKSKAIDYAKEQEFSDGDLFEDSPAEEPERKRGRPKGSSRKSKRSSAAARVDEQEAMVVDGVYVPAKPIYTEKGYDPTTPPIRERFPFLPEYEPDGSPRIDLIVGRRPIDEKGADEDDGDSNNSDDDNHVDPSSDDNDDVDDDDDDDDESGSLRSNSSIPLELLSVCGIYTGDSLTSSLSSSSGDSDGSGRILNPVERTGEEEEEENYELPQEVHIIEDNPDQDLTETASTHDTSGAVVCTASSSSESTDSQWAHADQFRYLLQNFWLALSAWSLSVLEFPKSAVRSIQQTFIFKYLTRVARKLSLQTTRLVNAFQIFSQYLGDAKDIAAALTAQLLTTIRVLLATITKALILIAAFLFQVWKYSLIQAVEDPNVTICYLVFYFMPDFCSLMMDLLNIPHWTPHLMTSLAVFLLCNQIKPGPLFTQDVSILQLTETRDKGAKDSYSHVSSKSEAPKDHINRRDERACKTILKILRFVLPIFFLADGFSIEFGTILGVSGASRLTTAFMMSLVRKNLVSSPVGWVSWAVQVLVATHYPSWKLLDHVVLVVGLSSIRLIRYLEGERFKEKKRN